MIVTPVAGGLQLVTQPDHAALAADILGLWRRGDLTRHPRREELLVAVREHDNGWREADAAPRLDPATGDPLDFRRYPRAERFEVWARTLERLTAAPYGLALVAQHGLEVHRDRAVTTWGGFRRSLEARRDEALAEAEIDLAELTADYSYLALADSVSLIACGAFEQASRGEFSIRRSGGGVEIDPFPLAGATTFHLPAREIPQGPYDNGVELVGRLAGARWLRRPIRVVPAGAVIP